MAEEERITTQLLTTSLTNTIDIEKIADDIKTLSPTNNQNVSPEISIKPVLSSDSSSVVSAVTTFDDQGNELVNNPETGYYDEIEIEDMDYDEISGIYTYPCPCGDKFVIHREDLFDGEEIAHCPSCSLIIRIIYDPEDFHDEEESDSD